MVDYFIVIFIGKILAVLTKPFFTVKLLVWHNKVIENSLLTSEYRKLATKAFFLFYIPIEFLLMIFILMVKH
jgi:hypothetical protein